MRLKINILAGLGLALGGAYLWLGDLDGRFTGPFAFVLFLFLLSGFLGFVDRSYNPFRFLAEAGAFCFFLLALLLIHNSAGDRRGLDTIRQIIRPYPGIGEVNALPVTSGEQVGHWLAYTPDNSRSVGDFYQGEQNHEGWDLVSPPPLLVFRQGGRELWILISERGESTRIYYNLRRQE